MDKELKYLLEELKDTTNDYVGTNGCLYQDLLREELNLLLDYIKNLEQQCKKQKEVIDRAIKILDIIIYDLDEHEEALPPTKEELCKVFGILKEVSNE